MTVDTGTFTVEKLVVVEVETGTEPTVEKLVVVAVLTVDVELTVEVGMKLAVVGTGVEM